MKLGLQYLVDIAVPSYKDGTTIDHDKIERIMLEALRLAQKEIEEVVGQKIEIGTVLYETEYEIEDDGSTVTR